METIAMNYSPYQIAIFDHVRAQWGALKRRRAGDTGAQPRNLVVQATAGSGKTTSIVHMCRQIPDARVEVVSFNSRVARDISGKLPSNASSVTLHAVGKRALEEYFGRRFMEEGKRGGNDGELAKNKTGRIVAKLKAEGVVGQFVNTSQVCKLVSRAKGIGIVPAGAAVGRKSPVAAVGVTPDEDGVWMDLIEAAEIPVKYGCHGELIRAAREVLRVSLESASACIDFDDMLYVAVVLPDLRFPRRDVVAVDELQDLDPMQRRMVVRMCEDALFVGVGDRMQAIYSWRGADADSMDRCVQDLRCDELPLSISYRCPASHVRLAREITHLIEARTDAPEGVIDYVKQKYGKDAVSQIATFGTMAARAVFSITA
jgi:DNA helicase-2/ATP-dependent DNA helicase PcrA